MKLLVKFILILLLVAVVHSIALSQVTEVRSITIPVSEMDRSVNFYTELLGFKKISDHQYKGEQWENLEGLFGLNMRVVRLQLGNEFIDLVDYITSGGRSIPEEAKSNDLIFQHIAIVVSDMEKAYALLRKNNITNVSTEPQTLPISNVAAAGIKAFYFQDPDRHNLELIYFPKGKGAEKWQLPTNKLFLGIDHTAIGIKNTDQSLLFYRDLLGLERKGESWNKGTEQAHLNFVEGASLHITGLRASKGPGIEFLEYLVPGPGKPYPDDSRADDLWHWQSVLFVKNIEPLYEKLQASGYKIVSKKMEWITDETGLKKKAFIVRDTDGHAMLLAE